MLIAADFRLQVTSWNRLHRHLAQKDFQSGRHAAHAIEALIEEAAAASKVARYDATITRVYPTIDDASIVKVRVMAEVDDVNDVIRGLEDVPPSLAHGLVSHLLADVCGVAASPDTAIGLRLLDVRPKRFPGVIGVADEKYIIEQAKVATGGMALDVA